MQDQDYLPHSMSYLKEVKTIRYEPIYIKYLKQTQKKMIKEMIKKMIKKMKSRQVTNVDELD